MMEKQRPRFKRLKGKSLIQRLFQRGKNIRSGPYHLIYLMDTELKEAYFGVSASKRKQPKAHQRNRTKRILREGFRKEIENFELDERFKNQNMALMLIFHSEKLPKIETSREKIKLILRRLKEQITKDEKCP